MQDRKQFWANNWKALPEQTKYSVNRPYCKAFHLTSAKLNHINNVVFQIIYKSMDAETRKAINAAQNHQGIIDWLSNTKVFFIDVANQLDSFMELEKVVLDSFQGASFLAGVNAIQLPIDIRIVHSAPPPNYLEKRKAVDFLHTDAWRGEPPDIVNCVLYCAVSDKTSQLVVYDIAKNEIDRFENYSGPEKEAGFLIENSPEIKFDHIPGEAVFFDAYTPHHTRRNGNKVRISLNFSFRRGDPYETLDERWDRAQQPWGKYWYMPEKTTDTFECRSNDELEKLIKSGKSKALSWRQDVIKKLRIPRKLEELYA